MIENQVYTIIGYCEKNKTDFYYQNHILSALGILLKSNHIKDYTVLAQRLGDDIAIEVIYGGEVIIRKKWEIKEEN